MKLQGTRSLVTGGSSGIGLALVEKLAAAGSDVYSMDIQPPLKDFAGVKGIDGDVTNEFDVRNAIRKISGGIDILINNAGIFSRKNLQQIEPEEFKKMWEVNMFGSWNVLQQLEKQGKLQPGATVVQMSSTVGLPGRMVPEVGPYSIVKQCVHVFTLLLRQTRPDLRVKGVSPNSVMTPMVTKGFASETDWKQQALAKWGVVTMPETIADKTVELIESDTAQDLVWDPTQMDHVLQ